MTSRRRRILFLNVGLAVVLVAAAAGGYFLFFRPAGADPTGMRTVPVQRGTVEAAVTANGTVEPAKSANVDFGTSGTVEKIKVSKGDKVDKGDVLARLDDSAQQQALTAARSKLTAADDSLDALEDEPECDSSNSSTGSNGGAGGGQSSCRTDAAVSSAQADVDSAEAGVSQAEADVAATRLTAPMSGTVVAINGTVGSSASGSEGSGSGSGSGSDSGSGNGSGGGGSGGSDGSSSSSSSGALDTSTGFVVIADLDDLVVDVSLAEADATRVKTSQHATVTFPALSGRSANGATGRVTSIDLTGSSSDNVVTYGVRVRLSSTPSGIRVGQTAAISIVTAKASNVLYLPTVAVHTNGGTSTVQLVQNGKTTTREVETGIKGDQLTQIRSGLKEGDEVVLVTAAQASQAANQNGFGNGGFGQRGGNRKPVVVQKP